MTRRGFTLVEMLMVVVIVMLLAGLGLLKYIDLKATARTTALAADFRAVTVAALNYYADHEEWPPDAGPGLVPAGLESYLPGGLAQSFVRPTYTLEFDNSLSAGAGMVAIAVTSPDTKQINKFMSTFSSRAPFFQSGGGRLSYLIAGPGGVF
ncbi:MAG: type II secretion system protein [Gemmatimonadales bacterium]